MIKEAKGIPGVKMDRWTEAHTVRHCALSLVGEPIMYPRIDEFLEDLHSRKISTFLVTNGQHPKAITSLRPITQLYVSVDAPTQESLIEIDRPLFRDAWDRLKESLVGLKDKGQRTVARLTVVKGWNSDEIEGYAKLVALGHCSLVEVKGVTFCGKSDASNLNMSNTPWHHEVVALTQTLQKELLKLRNAQIKKNSTNDPVVDLIPEYGLACEHKHSCSFLLAINFHTLTKKLVRNDGRLGLIMINFMNCHKKMQKTQRLLFLWKIMSHQHQPGHCLVLQKKDLIQPTHVITEQRNTQNILNLMMKVFRHITMMARHSQKKKEPN